MDSTAPGSERMPRADATESLEERAERAAVPDVEELAESPPSTALADPVSDDAGPDEEDAVPVAPEVSSSGKAVRGVVLAAGAVIVIAGLKAASAIMIPLLIALFVSILSYPLLARLRRAGVPQPLAVAITLLADFAILAGAAALVSGSVAELVRDRATYESRIRDYGIQIDERRANAAEWFEERGLSPPVWLREQQVETVNPRDGSVVSGAAAWWADFVDLDAIFGAANAAVRGAASVLTMVLIVTIITAFILLEAATFPRKLARALRDPEAESRYRSITWELQRYLLLKTGIGLVTGLLVGL